MRLKFLCNLSEALHLPEAHLQIQQVAVKKALVLFVDGMVGQSAKDGFCCSHEHPACALMSGFSSFPVIYCA